MSKFPLIDFAYMYFIQVDRKITNALINLKQTDDMNGLML